MEFPTWFCYEGLAMPIKVSEVTVCTRCGLCCDGSLFADVELASRDEASALEVMGLEIEDADEADRGLLSQPCGALQGKLCRIYAYRPECCRTFSCRLLQDVKRGVLGVDRAQAKISAALRRIERVKELLAPFGPGDESLPLPERCAEALALVEASPAKRETRRMRSELQAAMNSAGRFVRGTFLGG